MSTICCVCQEPLSNKVNKKNIFKDDLVIKPNSENVEGAKGINKPYDKIRLRNAIELITGHKILETEGSPSVICNKCFRKLQDFINFRAQLLTCFGILFHEQSSFNSLKHSFFETKTKKLKSSVKNNDLDDLIETSDCPKLPSNQLTSEDLINVDENSDSIDFTVDVNNEDRTTDYTNKKLHNHQKNTNCADSDSSNDDFIDVQNCDNSPIRFVTYNDEESEIDVCSGDDDEILEIESKNFKVNEKEEHNSSESEIEVCDYEPVGKRSRTFRSLSQSLTSDL